MSCTRTPAAEFGRRLFCLLFLGLLMAHPAHAVVTESDLRSAILGRATFTPAQMTEMDTNGDGKVDVADLIAFLTADGTPAAWFASGEVTVTEFQGAVSLPVTVSKSFTGNLTIQVSGTAGNKDYGPIALSVPVTGATVNIPITILTDTLLEGSETLVVTLVDPGEGGSYRVALPSVSRVVIRDGSGGTCVGGLSYQPGVQLPSLGLGLVVNQGTAHFRAADGSLLPVSFTAAASGNGEDSLSLESASGSFTASALGGREVEWQLTFSNGSLVDGFFTADYRLSYDKGVTAAADPLVLEGVFRCSMLE